MNLNWMQYEEHFVFSFKQSELITQSLSQQQSSASNFEGYIPIDYKLIVPNSNGVLLGYENIKAPLNPSNPFMASFPSTKCMIMYTQTSSFDRSPHRSPPNDPYFSRQVLRLHSLEPNASATIEPIESDTNSLRISTVVRGTVASLMELAWRTLYSSRGAIALECAIRQKRVPGLLLETCLRWNPYTLGPHCANWLD